MALSCPSDHGKDGSLYIGSSVGRVANRIRDSTFSLDGETFHVSANKAPHTLHGGKVGFDKANWTVSSIGDNSVSFQHISSAGDMGYPGTLTATATYSLADNGEVTVQYTATTDKTTIVNLVNHSYFNLSLTVGMWVELATTVVLYMITPSPLLGYNPGSCTHHQWFRVHAS